MQLRVRSNGSLLWNFNYRETVTKKRINIGFGNYTALSLANAWKMNGSHATWQRHVRQTKIIQTEIAERWQRKTLPDSVTDNKWRRNIESVKYCSSPLQCHY